MKTIILIIGILLPTVAIAAGPEYKSSVQWVIEHSPTNTPAIRMPLYVASVPGEPRAFACIMYWTNGITLRVVLDQTRYKDLPAHVMIMREDRPTELVFDSRVNATENPEFKLRPADLIFLERGDRPSRPR